MTFIANVKGSIKKESIGLYIMAFLIPFRPDWLGFGVLIIIVEQLIRRTPIRKQEIKSKLNGYNPSIWLFLFYLMYVVGLLWTENKDFAYMDLGMKSTLAIFPVFFILYRLEVDWYKFIYSFILGAFVAILLNIILSYIQYLNSHQYNAFFGVELSHFMHRGYWAIYLCVAYYLLLSIVFHKKKEKQALLLPFLLAIIIAFFVVLAESKMGLIVLAIISVGAVLKAISLLKRKILKVGIVLVVVFSGITVYLSIPSLKNRINQSIEVLSRPMSSYDKTALESTTARLFVWDSALELIGENFWLGVGTGDIKDELIKRNFENGYTGVAEAKLNSHNQLLNSAVAIGCIGVFFLIMTFIMNILSRNNLTYRKDRTWIIVILFLAMLPESVLEVQAGIIPYAFLLTVLTQVKFRGS